MTDLGGADEADDPVLGGWPTVGGPLDPSSPIVARGGDLPLVRGADHRCSDTPPLILRALEGMPDPGVIGAVRRSLGPCRPCVDALEVEIRFKIVMAQKATDKAPRSLQLRISETLKRVDLGEIDVTDL
jgi:hypothetical protein